MYKKTQFSISLIIAIGTAFCQYMVPNRLVGHIPSKMKRALLFFCLFISVNEAIHGQGQINMTHAHLSLIPLKKLAGQNPNNGKLFGNLIVKQELLRIMKNDYKKFAKEYAPTAMGNKIEFIDGVLFAYTWIPHWGYDHSLYFIDTKNQTSFMYWDDGSGHIKVYGQMPLSDNINIFINEFYKQEASDLQEGERDLLKSLSTTYGATTIDTPPDSTNVIVKKEEDDFVATSVEVEPHFKGGDEAFAKFLSYNIHYPIEAKNKKIEGKVWLSVIIDETGAVTKAKILRELGGGCDEEVLRVINLSPKWEPGMTKNHPVKCQYTIPINFSLNGQ